MTSDSETSYDQIPYDSHPYDRTHPDHLATMAALFGLSAPNVGQCRVLELGCAAGGNLIPQAAVLGGSEFVGVDLSRIQIDQGQKEVEALGLGNIQLQHRSIMDIGPEDGKFDYIICHGVYSWVSEPTREKILRICSENLSPNGVAYVSYNTNPGWFMRGMVRQMMCFHAKQFNEPKTQVEQARALLDFLINAGPAGDPTYHALLCRELEILRGRADSYLFHEHLEEDNEPVFFYEFNDRAEEHGLRYLSEVQLSEMVPGNFSQTAEATLRDLGVGLIHSEQYLDFLRNRTFRRTLLCHRDVELNRALGAGALERMQVSTQLSPEPGGDMASSAEMKFVSSAGATVSSHSPLAKAALALLSESWPGTVPFARLAALAHQKLGHSPIRSAENVAAEDHELASLVLELYAADLVELRVSPPRYKTEVEPTPRASPLARLQVERGPFVTTLRHHMIQLTDLQLHLVRLADGERDHDAICDELEKLVEDGQLVIEHDGEMTPELLRRVLGELLAADLNNLRLAAVLT